MPAFLLPSLGARLTFFRVLFLLFAFFLFFFLSTSIPILVLETCPGSGIPYFDPALEPLHRAGTLVFTDKPPQCCSLPRFLNIKDCAPLD